MGATAHSVHEGSFPRRGSAFRTSHAATQGRRLRRYVDCAWLHARGDRSFGTAGPDRLRSTAAGSVHAHLHRGAPSRPLAAARRDDALSDGLVAPGTGQKSVRAGAAYDGAPTTSARRATGCTVRACTCRCGQLSHERDGQERDQRGFEIGRGIALYHAFNRFGPSSLVRVRHSREVPAVVVEIGQLVGLIYRSEKWQAGRPRNFIHFMQDPPRLACNAAGTQLYVVGGNYRVTDRGIEG